MTKLVICCDGTWNTPDQNDRGVPAPTNVVRLYNAVAQSPDQKRYYHPGVGTDGSWWDRAVAGGTGAGLGRNIMSAYRWLCENYVAGQTDIYLFGFSRGAYTVRSLVGFINCCGLLDPGEIPVSELWPRIERLFARGYRAKTETQATWRSQGWAFHTADPVRIRFLGVWDTVGALGIPDTLPLQELFDDVRHHNFYDTKLSHNVTTARHAVAMDEMRESFQPTLWEDAEQHPDALQCWFPGVHSDVGGGYHEAGLADGALGWMIDEAQQAGLAFNEKMVAQVAPNVLDMMHDSCTLPFSAFPTQPRAIPSLRTTPVTADRPPHPARTVFHPSALQRHEVPPIHQSPYRQPHATPDKNGIDVEVFARQQWNPTGIWLEAGQRYQFEASGEWTDGSLRCGPAGTRDGHFALGEVAHLAGSMLGAVETGLRRLTGNEAVNVPFTRRHEEFPWFCLVGAVANGGGADPKGRVQPHETFLIGAGQPYVPKASGYLYAYANDAWHFYGNNRGKVDLRVIAL